MKPASLFLWLFLKSQQLHKPTFSPNGDVEPDDAAPLVEGVGPPDRLHILLILSGQQLLDRFKLLSRAATEEPPRAGSREEGPPLPAGRSELVTAWKARNDPHASMITSLSRGAAIASSTQH